jgi:hypothetical protein
MGNGKRSAGLGRGSQARRRAALGERLAAPDDDWLRNSVLEIKEENRDFGVKRVWADLKQR